MAHPATIVARWVAERLAPGGTLDSALATAGVGGAWPDVVPVGQAWGTPAAPILHVVYGEQSSGGDEYIIGQRRLVTDPLLRVAVVGRVGAAEQLDQAAQRIDALLHEAAGPVAGGEVLACTRERPLRLGPFQAPGTFRTYQLGGLYRLVIREE